MVNEEENIIVPTPPKKKKARCTFCNKNLCTIKMTCTLCNSGFCINHYLPEVHSCRCLYTDVPIMELPSPVKAKKIDKI